MEVFIVAGELPPFTFIRNQTDIIFKGCNEKFSKPECSELSVGDVVYFHKFAGKEIKLDNEIYRIMDVVNIEAKEV